MKQWQAILLTIFIVILVLMLPKELSEPISYLIIGSCAIWVYIDAKKLNTYKYKSNIGVSALALGFWTLVVWVIIFPAYLGLRYRIKNNLVPLKEKYAIQAGNITDQKT